MTDINDSQNDSEGNDEDSDPLDPFLCFPELMTKHQLLRVFKMRNVSPPTDQLIDGYEYCNLIALYNRVLLPLPQRKYRNNRKCRQLADKQIDCNKRSTLKRKFEENNNINEDFNNLKVKPVDHYSSPGVNANTTNAQLFNQRHDSKRQKILWP